MTEVMQFCISKLEIGDHSNSALMKAKANNSLSKDLSPESGAVINICGGDEGITKTLREMLNEKLLWTEEVYSPAGIPQRVLPSPLLLNTEGMNTLRAISHLPSYYITKSEAELFKANGYEIASSVPQNAFLIDLGCG